MAENISVAIYTDSYHPAMDGVVVYIDNIARGLSRHNIDVTIVTVGGGKYSVSSPDGFDVIKTRGIQFPPYPQYNIGINPFRANKEIIKRNIDVIHTQTPFTMGFAGMLVSRHLRSPLISTFHSMVFDETVISSYSSSGSAMTKRLAGLLKKYLKWHYTKYDLVISPSDDIAGKIRNIGLENVTVLNNGIDLGKFHTNLSKAESRERLGIDECRKIILYLGRIGREKDLEILIDSWKGLSQNGIDVMIAGSGPHLEHYRNYAQKSGASNIEFLGFVPEDRKLLLYRSADIFCNPSDYEVQSTVDIEAMAMGTPILVPDESSQVELAVHGVSGEIFAHGNSSDLVAVAVNMFERIDSYRPQRIADNFSIEHHVEQLIALYRKCLDARID